MYRHTLHQQVRDLLLKSGYAAAKADDPFFLRLVANAAAMQDLFTELWGRHPEGANAFSDMLVTLIRAYGERPEKLRARDEEKLGAGHWFLSHRITGMSLYVDRFCGNLKGMPGKLDYLKELGVNLVHLMPVFESPEGESDGGYAVSDFRRVDKRFGTIGDLKKLQGLLQDNGMYLMLDIVFNHTSRQHEWARKAMEGDPVHQDYYYMYPDRRIPDSFDGAMPDIFPESAPGNFTYVPECGKWVMTVFHNYQWDLNYGNPRVFVEMLDTVLFYANLGVDVLRIDAPAFIWKEAGTTCQNLPGAHTILRLLRQCVSTAAPGMALLGEAIVAPADIMKYFGTGDFTAQECDLAYNATHMALQWDALATGDTRVMLAAQHEILQKPYGTSWITYTRCHDDIGLGYDDRMIREAGFDPWPHRKFLKDHYSGALPGSPAAGALFSVNPKTQDARISGSLASLCGLERALEADEPDKIATALKKIILMQAHSFFLGGLPMIFYGDEAGYTNDYSYMQDPGKSYDNRWMHRPVIDWKKNERRNIPGSIEARIFTDTRKLIDIRNRLDVVSDLGNLDWLEPHNVHVAGYLRAYGNKRIYAVFNFSAADAWLTWYAFRQHGMRPARLHDHWTGRDFEVGPDHEYLVLQPYGFHLLEPA